MKAIILAGGYGSRLGAITELIPKPMIPIGDKPILWHIIQIYASQGIKDIIICLGYKGDIIKEYFFNYKYYQSDFTLNCSTWEMKFEKITTDLDANITFVNTGLNTLKGGRIKRIEKYLNDNVNFLTYGDGVADIDLNHLLAFHKNHGKTVTITGVNPPSRFGELIYKNNRVISFEEKPQTSHGQINGGFMVFNRNMLDYLTPDEDCDFEFGVLEQLSIKGEVMVLEHPGKWECVDTERDLKHLNKLWLQGNAFWKTW